MDTIAVYAASFDPLTYGHIHCILKGYHMFDKLIVAIGNNPNKKYTFTTEERIKMIKDWAKETHPITVDSYDNEYLVFYAMKVRAQYLLRGIRSVDDFEYEKTLANFNLEHSGGSLTTVFIMPPAKIAGVSSSFVKGLVGYKHWEDTLHDYVPENVRQAMIKKFGGEFC
jgi:pantetheine-phosphate adenylyltransferase